MKGPFLRTAILAVVAAKYPGDHARTARVSLIEESAERKVRMAHVAIVGTHSTNGVAAIHSELLRTKTVPDFAELFPDRFNNKTNGVTPRRWLLIANPDLAGLVTDAQSRVLDSGDAPIDGLFAVGVDQASVMGGHYPSGGINLGPAMTFGYLTGRRLASTTGVSR